jgi:two-component system, OmpR family, alkaline phosphatase synthesis response regulator PhoP
MGKILIIEDDHDIVFLLSVHLRDLGYDLDSASDGLTGVEMAKGNLYELIVLDVMLPELDGIHACQAIRKAKIITPILMLTARGEELDKIIGLEAGADDYMTKPFSVREFVARVKAIIRREHRKTEDAIPNDSSIIQHGGLSIDTYKRKVYLHQTKIVLTPKEYDLLLVLAQNPGKYFTRHELLEQVWGYDFAGYDHTVSSHINRLRTKIESDIYKPKFILTSWSVGYCFNEDLEHIKNPSI